MEVFEVDDIAFIHIVDKFYDLLIDRLIKEYKRWRVWVECRYDEFESDQLRLSNQLYIHYIKLDRYSLYIFLSKQQETWP
jgi:hypothetical protein